MPSSVDVEWVRSKFPEFDDLHLLAQGGQKNVFTARSATYGDVVVKLVHPRQDLASTKREIEAVAKIQHDRVPKIYSWDHIRTPLGACVYIIEKRIFGESVRDIIKAAPFDVESLLQLAEQILESLAAAEAANIVHRDVKPDNIIKDMTGNYWLIDFGLARHLDLLSLTSSGDHFGKLTWGYAPVEQCRNSKHNIDSRVDLYALGVTLYECATGINPLRHEARDHLEILKRIERASFPELKLDFRASENFTDLVGAMTQKSRVHRPRTVYDALTWMREISVDYTNFHGATTWPQKERTP